MLSNFVSIKYVKERLQERKVIRLLYELVFLREPTRTLFFYPEIIMLGVILLIANVSYGLLSIMTPIIAAIVVYLVTSTNRFNHLGESYRYLEYNLYFLLPFIIAMVLVDAQQLNLVTTLGFYFLFVLMVALFFVLFVRFVRKFPGRDELKVFLKELSLENGAVVFPVPMKLGPELCVRADVISFWWQPGGITDNKLYDKYIQEYPYLRSNWDDLFDEYDVTHVIVNNHMLDLIDWEYDFSSLNKILENRNYTAYKANI